MSQHKCEFNFLSRSDGSALYSIGTTVMLASVHGPADVKVSNRMYDSLHLDICYSPTTGTSSIGEKAIESVIGHTVRQALLSHLHPRTAVSLTIQEMQSAGLALSASINAACLALLDAGIQMKSVFAAVTCCFTKDNVCIVEPSELEIKESESVLTYVFDGNKLEVITTHQEGSFEHSQLSSSLLKCQEAAKDIFAFYRNAIEQKYNSFYCHLDS